MAEFTPITTQEDFDKAIGDRLKRERKTLEEKYFGYLSPEDVQKKYAGYLSPEDVKKQYEKYLTPEEAAKKDAQIKKYETDSVKTRIALETGLPYEMASRLSGEDEASIRKDAEGISKLMGTQKITPAPLKDTEPSGKEAMNSAYKDMLNSLKGE